MRDRTRLVFSGSQRDRARSLGMLAGAAMTLGARHLIGAGTLPSWPYSVDLAHAWLKAVTRHGFDMTGADGGGIAASRAFVDAVSTRDPVLDRLRRTAANAPVPATWFTPPDSESVLMLYLHGGGYAYHATSHASLVAYVAEAVGAATLAPDYRLAPEHTWPAQLDDAIAAYDWLCAQAAGARRIAVAGDSAGGHLTLALLAVLLATGRPLPGCAVCIGPWVDLTNPGASMRTHERYDWVQKRMADRWAAWLLRATPAHPLTAPLRAVAAGSGPPPLLVHVGTHEILYDMIVEHGALYRAAGHPIVVQEWPEMTHDFHAFAAMLPASRDALRAIGGFVRQHCC